MVLGHTGCGAVTAAIKGAAEPGQISGLYQFLRSAVDAAQGDAVRAVRENVRVQTGILAAASPVLADQVRQRKLEVVGGVYDLASGKVSMMSPAEAISH
jgi:carbonic anhydrase